MTKLYLLVPCLLLAGFLIFERDFERKREAEEKVRAVAAEAKKQADDLARAQREQVAAADAKKRLDQREREDRERAEKKQRDYEVMIAQLKSQADQQTGEAERLTQELATLNTRLDELRTKRVETERAAFELARLVELQRVDRRSAELEIQRATTMVATRLTESRWANPAPGVK